VPIKITFFKYGDVFMGFYILHGLQGLVDPLPCTPNYFFKSKVCCIVGHGGFVVPGLEALRGLATGSPN